ncbi:MAG: hypothetical protein ACE5HD_00670 [Acidobacteriota bacterium]
MPNTLGHLGVQALVTRLAVRDIDLRWVALGCVIPDIPWILARVLRLLPFDPYDLRLYAVVQASLFFSLLFCGALAVFSQRMARTFAILGANAVMHLLLDALQTKWGNGVHFFAPFSWRMTSFDLFWPEDLPTLLLTACGVGFAAWALLRKPRNLEAIVCPGRWRALLAVLVLAAWGIAPVALIAGPEASDNHFIRTLRERNTRTGRRIELDRARLSRRERASHLITFAGEEIAVAEFTPAAGADPGPGVVSIRGRFVGPARVRVTSLHRHQPWLRDAASVLGLVIVLALWGRAPLRWRDAAGGELR